MRPSHLGARTPGPSRPAAAAWCRQSSRLPCTAPGRPHGNGQQFSASRSQMHPPPVGVLVGIAWVGLVWMKALRRCLMYPPIRSMVMTNRPEVLRE
eukprot:1157619-Pelagomonas_calceolata.AAC.34